MILPFMDINTPKGRYTAILDYCFQEEPETEQGHYVFDGIGHFNISQNGSIGFADIIKQFSLPLKGLTNQDLYNNICKFKTIKDVINSFKTSVNFDDRMIVTFIEFDYVPHEE